MNIAGREGTQVRPPNDKSEQSVRTRLRLH